MATERVELLPLHSTKNSIKNAARKYVGRLVRSERAQVNAQLQEDFQNVLQGQAVYLKSFFCAKSDFTLLQGLLQDLQANAGSGMVNWSRHLKHENPDFSPTFRRIIATLAHYFDVEVYASRLNFYRNGGDWKPFHHDSHAYGGREQREDFTMGASFGASRDLEFLHEPSGETFSFPQHNGDIFAFTTEVNKRFMHGVPKASESTGPRFSIIAWGRRTRLTPQNSGLLEQAADLRPDLLPSPVAYSREISLASMASDQSNVPGASYSSYESNSDNKNELVMGVAEAARMVDLMIQPERHSRPDAEGALPQLRLLSLAPLRKYRKFIIPPPDGCLARRPEKADKAVDGGIKAVVVDISEVRAGPGRNGKERTKRNGKQRRKQRDGGRAVTVEYPAADPGEGEGVLLLMQGESEREGLAAEIEAEEQEPGQLPWQPCWKPARPCSVAMAAMLEASYTMQRSHGSHAGSLCYAILFSLKAKCHESQATWAASMGCHGLAEQQPWATWLR
eukprot:g45312.t1